MNKIQINCAKGKESLTVDEQDIVNKIATDYLEKITRHVKDIESFEVYLKCHQKDGNSKRYRIDIRVSAPGLKVESTVDEWDLKDAANKVLTKVLNEIEHKTFKNKK